MWLSYLTWANASQLPLPPSVPAPVNVDKHKSQNLPMASASAQPLGPTAALTSPALSSTAFPFVFSALTMLFNMPSSLPPQALGWFYMGQSQPVAMWGTPSLHLFSAHPTHPRRRFLTIPSQTSLPYSHSLSDPNSSSPHLHLQQWICIYS